jgi:hypothetical protein
MMLPRTIAGKSEDANVSGHFGELTTEGVLPGLT